MEQENAVYLTEAQKHTKISRESPSRYKVPTGYLHGSLSVTHPSWVTKVTYSQTSTRTLQ